MAIVAETPAALVRHLHADERGFATTHDPRFAKRRQVLIRTLGRDWTRAKAVIRLAPSERDDVLARTYLQRLANQSPPLRTKIRVTAAPPRARLLAWYREGERRFGVRWQLLAAVNFVESVFGKIHNDSTAGAQGPMQFIPATWKAYGLGGDVHDPHDAILGAANYLAANGARTNERNALYHYNQSTLYGNAVLLYAHRIQHVPDALAEYLNWDVYVKTATGYRRISSARRNARSSD